jgi:tetratricopeptide (TPR) repeat protein
MRQSAKVVCAAVIALTMTHRGWALGPQDLKDCENSADVSRMIAACTLLAAEERLPPGLRSMALLKRGFGNFALDKIDAAAADFAAAIKLDPTNQYAHHELALARQKNGDVPGAIAAMTEAIRLNPTGAASHYSRGTMHTAAGQLDAALADFDQAIKLGPDKETAYTKEGEAQRPEMARVHADYYGARAAVSFIAGKFDVAVADYERALKLSDIDDNLTIGHYLARARNGNAKPTLGLEKSSTALTKWPKPLVDLLLGKATPATVIAAAKTTDEQCDAHYTIGQMHLISGDKAAAKVALIAARDSCPAGYRDRTGADAELKRLAP